jgi:stage V sporulation protein S
LEGEALLVSGKTRVRKLAGAVAGFLRERGEVRLRAIGSAAVMRAVAASAVARGFLASEGREVVAVPVFFPLEGSDGSRRSGIELRLAVR